MTTTLIILQAANLIVIVVGLASLAVMSRRAQTEAEALTNRVNRLAAQADKLVMNTADAISLTKSMVEQVADRAAVPRDLLDVPPVDARVEIGASLLGYFQDQEAAGVDGYDVAWDGARLSIRPKAPLGDDPEEREAVALTIETTADEWVSIYDFAGRERRIPTTKPGEMLDLFDEGGDEHDTLDEVRTWDSVIVRGPDPKKST